MKVWIVWVSLSVLQACSNDGIKVTFGGSGSPAEMDPNAATGAPGSGSGDTGTSRSDTGAHSEDTGTADGGAASGDTRSPASDDVDAEHRRHARASQLRWLLEEESKPRDSGTDTEGGSRVTSRAGSATPRKYECIECATLSCVTVR